MTRIGEMLTTETTRTRVPQNYYYTKIDKNKDGKTDEIIGYSAVFTHWTP